jgi:pyruvate carboxylase
MRLEAAPKFKSTRRVALVLGDLASGELICERLHEEGFETRLKTPPRFNSSVEQLKKLLRDFAEGEKGASLWLHPGVSPIAERSEWAILGRDLGITLIAPPARSVSLFNNRLTLLGEGEKIGISNLLLTSDPLHSVREIEKLIRTGKFKFPFVLKSVRGGSGFGVKVIHQAEDLGKSLQLWLEQIRRNQGEVIILAERYLEGARRIVQPFARFSDGKIELFPPIDASLTSRLRKIV